MTSSTDVATPALLYAALSGPFTPEQALRPLEANVDAQHLAMTASFLADTCDTLPTGASNRWLMRTTVRHSLLQSLDDEELAAAIDVRRQYDLDPESADVLGVLLDQAPLNRATIRAIIEQGTDSTQLERVIVALDRAGERAPARDLLPLARFALAAFHRDKRRQLVAERGFFGREDALAKINAWLTRSPIDGPVSCLYVTGAPGIGKSSLLAEAVRRHYERFQPLMLRLDFDRAGLDVQDTVGLTQEAARQLAEQLGEEGRAVVEARLQAGLVEERAASKYLGLRQQFPVRLADIIGEAIRRSRRSVFVVLDTLEVLRGRGETHPATLFQWLERMSRHGVGPMAVLAAGRGDALASLQDAEGSAVARRRMRQYGSRRIEVLQIDRLEHTAAVALLGRLGIQDEDYAELLAIGDGSPLKLRLAAEIARRTGVAHLRRKGRKRGGEVSAAFLYRLLLSRIDDSVLRRLAHPGLIVRRINAEVIQQVLAPALGLQPPSSERARSLLDQLASHHWLVESDPGAAGFLKHRSDMRRLLLPLLYESAPAQSAKVDAAAVRWFGARPEAWAQVEAVYHQLQLTRRGGTVPTVSARVAAQFDADALDELPVRAADIVRRASGQRTSQFRDPSQPGQLESDETSLEQELLGLIRQQAWQEGGYVVRRFVTQGIVDPRSQAADAIRTLFWRSGQWSDARRWLNERDRFLAADNDLNDQSPVLTMARLEMRAELAPATLRRRFVEWHPLVQRAYGATNSATDSELRFGALALIYRSLLSSNEHLSQSHDLEDPTAAAFERWGGVSTDGGSNRVVEQARTRLADAGLSNVAIDEIPFGSLLASLMPYAASVRNHIVARQREDVQEWARRAADILRENAGILHPRFHFESTIDSEPLVWLTNAGLFAEWLQLTTFVEPDRDLSLIARAAERWRRTMAGDWSYGRRPGRWRNQPALDETLTERLEFLMRDHAPANAARRQINMWSAALSHVALCDTLTDRLRVSLDEVRSGFANDLPLDLITRRLLARGAPAAVAPALAVLVTHRVL